jgi:CheY-like chemotaxis protein
LQDDDLVHHEGASDWVLLKDVPNLRAVGISAAKRITGRLLLLEPDELVCRMLLTGLQELRHSVLIANDLLSAQREIEEQPFDLVVLDADFHDASELLDRLGQRDCPTPVIVTSSRDKTSQIARVFASGAADYLTKPINLSVMAARVQAMLRLLDSSADIRSRLRQLGFSGMVDLPDIDNQLEQVTSGGGGAATLRAINDILRDVLHAERASVFRYDAERDELLTVVAHGVAGDSEGSPLIRMKADTGLAGATLRLDRTLNIPDAYADNRFNPQFDRETGFRTCTSSPSSAANAASSPTSPTTASSSTKPTTAAPRIARWESPI